MGGRARSLSRALVRRGEESSFPLCSAALLAWSLAAVGCGAGSHRSDEADAAPVHDADSATEAPSGAPDLPSDRDAAKERPPGGDAPASAGGARPCASLALCDDFEGAPVGGAPDATKWAVGAPDVTGTGALAVDDGQHHSGARSVKVTGEGGYSNHIFFSNTSVIATLGPVVWGRFYVRLTDALGDGHVTFLAMKDAQDGGKHLRMGGQSKIVMWNRESDDATLPALSPTGIALSAPLPTNRWVCVELMIDARAPAAMETWLDGVALAGLRLDATPTPDVDEQWLRKPGWSPALTDFALGWESYAGQPMTLWFDDVALDAARIGCLDP
jgi:hypothetical protein